MSSSKFRTEKTIKNRLSIINAKNIFLMLLSLTMLLSFASCSNDKQTEKSNGKNDSPQQTEDSQKQNGFSVQTNSYELIFETTDVKCQHHNRGYYNFLHKSGDYIFYMTLKENSCLMSLNINTGETKQIAYVDADINNPIQYTSTELMFNGSELGYDMKPMQYDIESEKLSDVNNKINAIDGEIDAIDNNEMDVIDESDLSQSIDITEIFRENVDEELYIDEDNIFRTDNDLYVFIDELGVYTIDENNKPIQLSKYPADSYIIYETEQKFIYQDNAIYYRAAAPHNDLIIKLENGKETVIKTADELKSQDLNFTGSLISNTLTIRNDEVWYELSDERYHYVDGNKVPYYITYLACVDENGNIKNIFNVGEPDLIAFDDEYIYYYGWMNQEAGIENGEDQIGGFFRIKIDDTKVN